MVGCIEVVVPLINDIVYGIGVVMAGGDGILGAVGVVCWSVS